MIRIHAGLPAPGRLVSLLPQAFSALIVYGTPERAYRSDTCSPAISSGHPYLLEIFTSQAISLGTQLQDVVSEILLPAGPCSWDHPPIISQSVHPAPLYFDPRHQSCLSHSAAIAKSTNAQRIPMHTRIPPLGHVVPITTSIAVKLGTVI